MEKSRAGRLLTTRLTKTSMSPFLSLLSGFIPSNYKPVYSKQDITLQQVICMKHVKVLQQKNPATPFTQMTKNQ